jgi:hypothetical protein
VIAATTIGALSDGSQCTSLCPTTIGPSGCCLRRQYTGSLARCLLVCFACRAPCERELEQPRQGFGRV